MPQYNLQSNAIGVFPSGVGGSWVTSENGIDVALFDTLLAYVESNYCVDPTRIYAVGWSFGASMANSIACFRATTASKPGVRAFASFEGGILGGISGGGDCKGPIPGWVHEYQEDPTTDVPPSFYYGILSLFVPLDHVAGTSSTSDTNVESILKNLLVNNLQNTDSSVVAPIQALPGSNPYCMKVMGSVPLVLCTPPGAWHNWAQNGPDDTGTIVRSYPTVPEDATTEIKAFFEGL